ncbi:hypothetical protein HZR84_03790 [Hyphobacterium sp. CCMP332]|nr:hypothetical protein HZR84_03790 [Hyphobacterium sp. CCMP332]
MEQKDFSRPNFKVTKGKQFRINEDIFIRAFLKVLEFHSPQISMTFFAICHINSWRLKYNRSNFRINVSTLKNWLSLSDRQLRTHINELEKSGFIIKTGAHFTFNIKVNSEFDTIEDLNGWRPIPALVWKDETIRAIDKIRYAEIYGASFLDYLQESGGGQFDAQSIPSLNRMYAWGNSARKILYPNESRQSISQQLGRLVKSGHLLYINDEDLFQCLSLSPILQNITLNHIDKISFGRFNYNY